MAANYSANLPKERLILCKPPPLPPRDPHLEKAAVVPKRFVDSAGLCPRYIYNQLLVSGHPAHLSVCVPPRAQKQAEQNFLTTKHAHACDTGRGGGGGGVTKLLQQVVISLLV